MRDREDNRRDAVKQGRPRRSDFRGRDTSNPPRDMWVLNGLSAAQCYTQSGGPRAPNRPILLEAGIADVRQRATASVKANADRFAKNVLPVIRDIQLSGVTSHRAIARTLNARAVGTARGGQWTAVQVGAILQRA
jgi:hypothetical protein